MSFVVRFSVPAEADLIRLFEFLLERAVDGHDLKMAQATIEAICLAAS